MLTIVIVSVQVIDHEGDRVLWLIDQELFQHVLWAQADIRRLTPAGPWLPWRPLLGASAGVTGCRGLRKPQVVRSLTSFPFVLPAKAFPWSCAALQWQHHPECTRPIPATQCSCTGLPCVPVSCSATPWVLWSSLHSYSRCPARRC